MLLSNTHVWHLEFVRERFTLLEPFDQLVVSFDVRAVKPERAIFDAVTAVLDCAPHEAFYTDDITSYVETGRAYGWHAETFTDAAALREQLARFGILCGESGA